MINVRALSDASAILLAAETQVKLRLLGIPMARFLREDSPNGLMFATNDCPELYFLFRLKDVMHDDTGVSPEILKTIQADDLNLMIINDAPCFPGAAMRPDVKAELI